MEAVFKSQATQRDKTRLVGYVCIKECVNKFLKEYSSGKVGFVRNVLAHVEKSRLVLAQKDALSCWLKLWFVTSTY